MNKENLKLNEIKKDIPEQHIEQSKEISPSYFNQENDRNREIINESRTKIEELANTKNEANQKIDNYIDKKEATNDQLVSTDLQATGLSNELRRIRRKLNPIDKTSSKIIHSPLISSISDKSSKTIARPSGILGGAILALIGSIVYYYFAKSVGIKYNYSIYIILFVGGFIIGIILELIIRLFIKTPETKP